MRLYAVYAVSKSSVQKLERTVLPRSCASDNNARGLPWFEKRRGGFHEVQTYKGTVQLPERNSSWLKGLGS